jgi:hypothetical protein
MPFLGRIIYMSNSIRAEVVLITNFSSFVLGEFLELPFI